MRIEVIKSYRWAPDGNHVREVLVGEVREDEGAEVAMQMGCGREMKAEPAAPENRAHGGPPRNKSKG